VSDRTVVRSVFAPARPFAAIAAGLFTFAALVLVGGGAACATARVHPALYEAESFALVSVHARRDVWMDSGFVLMPSFDNELGTEVIEMTIGDTEADLARLFGVEELVPLVKVLENKQAQALPEASPPEDWTQVDDIIAVDVDAPDTPRALGRVAAALGVDAAVVLRHEWSVAPDRLQMTNGLTAYDRCTLLVADARGQVLVHDSVLASAPLMSVGLEPRMFGLHAASFSDEVRTLARRTGRECIDLLKRRIAQARPARVVAPRKG
jgi:hypothetical protein